MYKVKHTKMRSETITNIFKPRDLCYNLRNSDFLLPRFNKVSFSKHSLLYLGPTLWSKLDKNDKTCKSLSEFTETECEIRIWHRLFMIDAKHVFCVIVDVSSETILAFHHLVLSVIAFSTIVS